MLNIEFLLESFRLLLLDYRLNYIGRKALLNRTLTDNPPQRTCLKHVKRRDKVFYHTFPRFDFLSGARAIQKIHKAISVHPTIIQMEEIISCHRAMYLLHLLCTHAYPHQGLLRQTPARSVLWTRIAWIEILQASRTRPLETHPGFPRPRMAAEMFQTWLR